MGVPVVLPSNTPERISTVSDLAALRDMARGAGLAPVEVGLDIGFAQLHARRATIDDAADGRAVRFAEGGDGEQGAESVSRHDYLAKRCAKVARSLT